jgi:hypothetical protein
MSTNRTINFYGYAYGNVPVQLNAHINGELVFSGAVPTLDEPVPSTEGFDMTNAPILFAVTDSALFPVEFAGTYPLTISVATGDGILQGNTFSNYMIQTEIVHGISVPVPGTTDIFSNVYNCMAGNSDACGDSRRSVLINGSAMAEDRTTDGQGQWTIEILAGSTMSCDFSVSVGDLLDPEAYL